MTESIADIIANDLRRLPMETRKAIRPKLRKAGDACAAAVRKNASWSTRIPDTTKVGTSFRLDREGVTVSVGGTATTPHAWPYEGRKRNPFRHPVHARPGTPRSKWTWVPEPARPYLAPAAKSTEGQTTAMMRGALDEVGVTLGFV